MDYVLRSEARRNVRRWWAPLAALNIVMVLLQTILGQYAAIAGTAWFWLLLAIVPGTILLYAGGPLSQRLSASLIERVRVRMLVSVTITFLVLLLLTNLLSQAAVNASDLGLRGYLWRSLWWLLPMNILSTYSLWNNLLAAKPKLLVNTQLIQQHAAERGAAVSTAAHPLRKQALDLIAENNIAAAFELLEQYFGAERTKDRQQLDHLALLRGEYRRLREGLQLDTIEPAVAQRQLNRIALALLQMSAELAA